MKNPPTLLSGQFRSVTAAKVIMKNSIPGQSYYKRFCFCVKFVATYRMNLVSGKNIDI